MEVEFVVPGDPAPQGSKRAYVGKSGKVSMVESSSRVKPWREAAAAAARAAADGHVFDGPVRVEAQFRVAHAASHFRSGRNSHLLKASAPEAPTKQWCGDVDKLSRALLDSLTMSGVIADDSHVVALDATKVWSWPGFDGSTRVRVIAVDPTLGAEADGPLLPVGQVRLDGEGVAWQKQESNELWWSCDGEARGGLTDDAVRDMTVLTPVTETGEQES